MSDFKDRLIQEKSDLDGRIEKLTKFLDTDLFQHLSHIERDALTEQLYHMKQYKAVLDARVKRICENVEE